VPDACALRLAAGRMEADAGSVPGGCHHGTDWQGSQAVSPVRFDEVSGYGSVEHPRVDVSMLWSGEVNTDQEQALAFVAAAES
jgi:hypothetical protein